MKDVIEEAIAIIKARSEAEDKEYNEQLTYWRLEGILHREGPEVVLDFANNAPFQKEQKIQVGYA